VIVESFTIIFFSAELWRLYL